MLALCIAAFLSFGIVLVLVGANQAALASELALDLEQTGLLSGALALGAGIGITAAGPLYDRYPRRPLFALSALLAAAALLSVHDAMTFGGLFARIAVAGLGAGAYNTVVNATLAERYEQEAARPLALVHASATIGAIVGPPVYGLLTHWTVCFQLAGAAHVLLCIAALLLRDGWPPPKPRGEVRERLSWLALAPMLAVVFGYVSIEGTCTVFAVPYAMSHLQLDAARGQTAISALWVGVLMGRGLLLALGKRAGASTIVLAGVATVAAVGIGIGMSLAQVELVFAAIGAAVGSVYPLTMAIIGERFASARGTAAGLAGGAGAVGAVIATWLTGVVGDVAGVGVGLLTIGGYAALILVGGWLMKMSAQRVV